MANNCFYKMTAVSDSEENLLRFKRILNYEDDKAFLPRVFSADFGKISKDKASGLFVCKVEGDTAWNFNHLLCDNDDTKELVTTKDGKDVVRKGCTLHGLSFVCEELDIGIEVWSEESGCCFQEHIAVDHNGNEVCVESTEWTVQYTDDDGEDLEEPIENGGFEDYGVFAKPWDIYGDD